MITKQQALDCHRIGRPGKVQVVPTKPVKTRLDLSMAYTPGVAAPCLEIQKHPEDAYAYTARGNLVAEITNGTYIIPKPFDPRVLIHESMAVAKAAMDSGVARQPVDLEDYRRRLEGRLEEIAAL